MALLYSLLVDLPNNFLRVFALLLALVLQNLVRVEGTIVVRCEVFEPVVLILKDGIGFFLVVILDYVDVAIVVVEVVIAVVHGVFFELLHLQDLLFDVVVLLVVLDGVELLRFRAGELERLLVPGLEQAFFLILHLVGPVQ